MKHIPLISKDEVDPEFRERWDNYRFDLAIFHVWAHVPEAFKTYTAFNGTVWRQEEDGMPLLLKEIAVVHASVLSHSSYEWGNHGASMIRRGGTQEQLDALNAFGRPVPQGLKMPSIEESVAAGQYLVGPADRITEQLMEVQQKYPGLQEINIGVTNMGMPTSASMDQLEWFAKDVMPHFETKQGSDN